jgi:hypothetical protein
MKARSLLFVFALSFVASPVLAQVSDADRNAARDLYVEGVALQKAGKYQEALDRFQRSLAVYPVAPTTAYHMAQCKEALGQLVEAAEQLRLVRDTPLPPGASEAFNQAKNDAAAELTQLEARLPKVKIEILPAGIQGLVVTIDGAQMPTALLNVPRPINPGSHRIAAQAPGYAPGQQQVDMRERQQQDVSITLQPGAGGVQYSNVPNNNGGTNPNTGNPSYPNNGGYANPNGGYNNGGYQGGGYSPYGTWVPPRRRPEGPRNAFLLGIDLALTVPFGDDNVTNNAGIGGALGVDVGLRLARVIYLGAWLQGSDFFGNDNNAGSGGGAFAANGVFGVMSGPDAAGVYFEIGGGVRYLSTNIVPAGSNLPSTQGEFLIGIGAQVKAGNLRFIPKIDFFIDPEPGNTHGFFTLGITGFYEMPLDKPAPQQPNDPNAAPPPPAAY